MKLIIITPAVVEMCIYYFHPPFLGCRLHLCFYGVDAPATENVTFNQK